MDFADDFTYFTFEQVLEEARRLYRHNKHLRTIRLDHSANDEPILEFHVTKPARLGLHQLGLPVTFRCMATRMVVANDA